MDVGALAPMESTQAIDIVVITHNKLELTVSCIAALYENTTVPFHLIVVDDSTDWTPQYFEWLKTQHENITFIHSDTPYREGNQIFNIAMEHGDTPYLVTVMNSVRVEPDWEGVALKLMTQNPKIGAIGFKCLFPNGLIESAGIGLIGFAPVDIGKWEAGHRRSCVYECQAIQWSFALLRKEAIGKLEENIYNGFKGWDDIDNCFTLTKRGWQVWYNGLGVGYHTPRATRGNSNEELETYKANHENSIIFYKRWGLWGKVQANVKAQSEIAKKIKGHSWRDVKGIMNG